MTLPSAQQQDPTPLMSSDTLTRYVHNGIYPSCESDVFLYYDMPLLFVWRPLGAKEGPSFLVGYTNFSRFHETLLIILLSPSKESLYRNGVISYREIIENCGDHQLFLARCGLRRLAIKAVHWKELPPDELPVNDSYVC